MMNSGLQLEIGGVTLDLQYRAANLFVLTELTGKSPLDFFLSIFGEMPTKNVEMTDELKLRIGSSVTSLSIVVPLLVAGLAHHDEYAGLGPSKVHKRVCALLDAEAETSELGLVKTIAKFASELVVAFKDSLLPPATKTDASRSETKTGDKIDSPLPETASSLAGTI